MILTTEFSLHDLKMGLKKEHAVSKITYRQVGNVITLVTERADAYMCFFFSLRRNDTPKFFSSVR
jgi:hypothetical protein